MAEKNDSNEQLEERNGSDEEKQTGVKPTGDATEVEANQVLTEFTEEEARAIIRKVDFRLVPLLSILYLIAYVDRSNIGNAKIAGMSDDLELTGNRYNVALTVFFVPYALFEIPSNIVLKLIRPSIWIPILVFSWGTVMTLMGTISTYHGLVAARFFLGVAEAGFFPAATYLLTIWYQRYEVQRRMSVFYAAASLSGAFSGLLAYAIEKMKGIAGLGGWKWIFILEGLVPVVVALTLYFFLPDRPETAKFLTERERLFVVDRIALGTGSGRGRITNADKVSWANSKVAFSDWKVWMATIPFWACSISTYGFTATVPTVLKQMGYTTGKAQLLTIPIYVFGMTATLIVAFWSDKIQQRTPFIMGGLAIAVAGFIGELAVPHPHLPGVTYFFLFLVAAGLYCPFTAVVTLVGNNIAPSSKRAIGMALLISIGNLGGICGSNIYFAAEAPKYHTGFGVSLAICAAGILAAWVLRKAYQKENRLRDELLERDGEEAIRAKYTEQELLDLGDLSPFYRYTI